MLVLSASITTLSRANAQVNLNASGTPTTLTLNDVSAKVRLGENVTLSGTLTTLDGHPIDGVPVTVYLMTPEPKIFAVGSSTTSSDGTYQVVWNVQAISKIRPDNDVTQKVTTQTVSLFAQFDGSGSYAPSKTGKVGVVLESNAIKVYINADKNVYKVGDTATVFVAILDLDDNFVDPDTMKATFANVDATSTSRSLGTNPQIPITDQMDHKKVGSYVYITTPLKPGNNQIVMIPFKAGYNTEITSITLIVLTGEQSRGRF